jgi:TonB family protein
VIARLRFRLRAAIGLGLLAFLGGAGGAAGQVTGAQLVREQKPLYPEGLVKMQKQGNVILTGRIDKNGKVQDIQPVAATNLGFVDASVDAVSAWQFRPAARGGKPIDTATNIVVRFRLDGKKRGDIPRAVLGDLSVFPANAAGARSGADGIPLHRGADPRLRVETVVDIPPSPKAQRVTVAAQAVSPRGRKISLWAGSAAVAANRPNFPVSFSYPIGADWEDGIWNVLISVGDGPAGGGQFWLAGDPEHFDFAGLAAKNAAATKSLPPVPVLPQPTRPPSKTPQRLRKT